jgi:hypothetical protein
MILVHLFIYITTLLRYCIEFKCPMQYFFVQNCEVLDKGNILLLDFCFVKKNLPKKEQFLVIFNIWM